MKKSNGKLIWETQDEFVENTVDQIVEQMMRILYDVAVQSKIDPDSDQFESLIRDVFSFLAMRSLVASCGTLPGYRRKEYTENVVAIVLKYAREHFGELTTREALWEEGFSTADYAKNGGRNGNSQTH